MSLEEQYAATLIAEAMHEAEENSTPDKARQERKDTGAAMVEAEAAYNADKTIHEYGKKVAGLLRA